MLDERLHPFVDVFKTFGVESVGDCKEITDREINKTVYRIQGNVGPRHYLSAPKSRGHSLGLTGEFIYLQIKALDGRYFNIHLDFQLPYGINFRLSLSTLQKQAKIQPKSLIYPLVVGRSWTIICIHVPSIMQAAELTSAPQSPKLKSLQVCASVLVKSIFTSNFKYSFTSFPRDMKLCTRNVPIEWVEIPSPKFLTELYSPKVIRAGNAKAAADASPPVRYLCSRSSVPRPTSCSRSPHARGDASFSHEASFGSGDHRGGAGVGKSFLASQTMPEDHGATHPQHAARQPYEFLPNPREAAAAAATMGNHGDSQGSKSHGCCHASHASRHNCPPAPGDTASSPPVAKNKHQVEKVVLKDPVLEMHRHTGIMGASAKWISSSEILYVSSLALVQLNVTIADEPRIVLRHGTQITLLQVSPDFTRAATVERGTDSNICRLWPIRSGKLWTAPIELVLTAVVDAVTCDFDTRARRIVFGGYDRQRRFGAAVYEIGKTECILIARQVSDVHIEQMRFGPDDHRIVSCGKGNIRFWRIKNNHLLGQSLSMDTCRNIHFLSVAFECSRSLCEKPRVFVGNHKGEIFALDYHTREVKNKYQLHDGPIRSICANDGFVITCSDDKFMKVWPLDFSQFYLQICDESHLTSVDMSLDELNICSTTRDGAITILNLDTHKSSIKCRNLSSEIVDSAFAESFEELVTIGKDKNIEVWDISTMTQALDFTSLQDTPLCVACHPLRHIFAVGFESGVVRIFNCDMMRIEFSYRHHLKPIISIAFSKEIRQRGYMITCDTSGAFQLYDQNNCFRAVATPEVALCDAVPEGCPAFILSPCYKWIGRYSNERKILILEFPDLTLLRTVIVDNDVVTFKASFDGSYLLVGCGDNKIRIYSASKGTIVQEVFFPVAVSYPLGMTSFEVNGFAMLFVGLNKNKKNNDTPPMHADHELAVWAIKREELREKKHTYRRDEQHFAGHLKMPTTIYFCPNFIVSLSTSEIIPWRVNMNHIRDLFFESKTAAPLLPHNTPSSLRTSPALPLSYGKASSAAGASALSGNVSNGTATDGLKDCVAHQSSVASEKKTASTTVEEKKNDGGKINEERKKGGNEEEGRTIKSTTGRTGETFLPLSATGQIVQGSTPGDVLTKIDHQVIQGEHGGELFDGLVKRLRTSELGGKIDATMDSSTAALIKEPSGGDCAAGNHTPSASTSATAKLRPSTFGDPSPSAGSAGGGGVRDKNWSSGSGAAAESASTAVDHTKSNDGKHASTLGSSEQPATGAADKSRPIGILSTDASGSAPSNPWVPAGLQFPTEDKDYCINLRSRAQDTTRLAESTEAQVELMKQRKRIAKREVPGKPTERLVMGEVVGHVGNVGKRTSSSSPRFACFAKSSSREGGKTTIINTCGEKIKSTTANAGSSSSHKNHLGLVPRCASFAAAHKIRSTSIAKKEAKDRAMLIPGLNKSPSRRIQLGPEKRGAPMTTALKVKPTKTKDDMVGGHHRKKAPNEEDDIKEIYSRGEGGGASSSSCVIRSPRSSSEVRVSHVDADGATTAVTEKKDRGHHSTGALRHVQKNAGGGGAGAAPPLKVRMSTERSVTTNTKDGEKPPQPLPKVHFTSIQSSVSKPRSKHEEGKGGTRGTTTPPVFHKAASSSLCKGSEKKTGVCQDRSKEIIRSSGNRGGEATVSAPQRSGHEDVDEHFYGLSPSPPGPMSARTPDLPTSRTPPMTPGTPSMPAHYQPPSTASGTPPMPKEPSIPQPVDPSTSIMSPLPMMPQEAPMNTPLMPASAPSTLMLEGPPPGASSTTPRTPPGTPPGGPDDEPDFSPLPAGSQTTSQVNEQSVEKKGSRLPDSIEENTTHIMLEKTVIRKRDSYFSDESGLGLSMEQSSVPQPPTNAQGEQWVLSHVLGCSFRAPLTWVEHRNGTRVLAHAVGSWIHIDIQGHRQVIPAQGKVLCLHSHGPLMAAVYEDEQQFMCSSPSAREDRSKVPLCLRMWQVGSEKDEHLITVSFTKTLPPEYNALTVRMCVIGHRIITTSETRCDAWSGTGMMISGHIPGPAVTIVRCSESDEFVTIMPLNIILWRLTNQLTLQFQFAEQPEWMRNTLYQHKYLCASFDGSRVICGTSAGSLVVYDWHKNELACDVTVEEGTPIDQVYAPQWPEEVIVCVGSKMRWGRVMECNSITSASASASQPHKKTRDSREHIFAPFEHLDSSFDGRCVEAQFSHGHGAIIATEGNTIWEVPFFGAGSSRKKRRLACFHGKQITCMAVQHRPGGSSSSTTTHNKCNNTEGMIATGGEDGVIHLWGTTPDHHTLSNLAQLRATSPCRSLAFLITLPHILIATFEDSYVRVFDCKKMLPVAKCPVSSQTEDIIYMSPFYAMHALLCAGRDGQLAMICFRMEVEEGDDGDVACVDAFRNHMSGPQAAGVGVTSTSSCETHVLATFGNGEVWIWEACEYPKLIRKPWPMPHPSKRGGECVYHAEFLNTTYLVGTADCYAYVYDFTNTYVVSRINVGAPVIQIHSLLGYGSPTYVLYESTLAELQINSEGKLLGCVPTILGVAPAFSSIHGFRIIPSISAHHKIVFLFNCGISSWRMANVASLKWNN